MRRDIEKRLRDGEIRAVVATNALELGIDVGALDAVVCVGYLEVSPASGSVLVALADGWSPRWRSW